MNCSSLRAATTWNGSPALSTFSLELISQSDPSVVEVVSSNLMDQYAIVTEAEFAVDVIAAATAGGAALPTSTWAAFSAALIGESAEIRAATGVPGDRLALTTASWMAVVGLLNPSQPSISFGAGPDFTAETFLGGWDRRVPCTRPRVRCPVQHEVAS